MKNLSTALVLAAFLCLAPPAVVAAGDTIDITILHTNDMHGHILGPNGGPGRFPALYDAIREQRRGDEAPDKDTVLVDGGDILEGSALDFLTRGAMMVEALSILRYDAWTIGNHDFWIGRSNLGRLVKKARRDGIVVLGANIIDENSGICAQDLAVPYTVIEKDGVKLAFLGLSHPDTAALNSPRNTRGLFFEDPVSTAARWAARIDGADLVVVLGHIGAGSGRGMSYSELSRLPECVRVFIDAHSHRITRSPKVIRRPGGPGILVVQAGSNLEALGRLTLYFDRLTHRVLTVEDGSLRFDYEMSDLRVSSKAAVSFLVDSNVDRELVRSGQAGPSEAYSYLYRNYAAPFAEKIGKCAGRAGARLARPSPGASDPFGNLICDAERQHALGCLGRGELDTILSGDAASAVSRLLAIDSPNSIRGVIDLGEEISLGDIYEHLPFDNTLSVVALPGRELRRLLECAFWNRRNGGLLVSGLSARIDFRAARGERVRYVWVNGNPVNDKATYYIVTSDYIADGRSFWKHARLEKQARVHLNVSSRAVLWWYLLQHYNEDDFIAADLDEARLAVN